MATSVGSLLWRTELSKLAVANREIERLRELLGLSEDRSDVGRGWEPTLFGGSGGWAGVDGHRSKPGREDRRWSLAAAGCAATARKLRGEPRQRSAGRSTESDPRSSKGSRSRCQHEPSPSHRGLISPSDSSCPARSVDPGQGITSGRRHPHARWPTMNCVAFRKWRGISGWAHIALRTAVRASSRRFGRS